MKNVLVFGGTAEGRRVCEYLSDQKVSHTVCVATEYGEEVLKKDSYTRIHQGRLTREEMEALIREQEYQLVIDATHPYAAVVSENVRAACQSTGAEYLRYLRPGSINAECAATAARQAGSDGAQAERDCVFVSSAAEAAEYLEGHSGRIFLTTGSKELHVFTERISQISRLFARVLPSAEVISSCRALGLEGKQLCAMQGPFSLDMNVAMLRQTKAAFLVTKDTGLSGGFPEKEEAARRAGVRLVVIRRPPDGGMDWEELKKLVDQRLGLLSPEKPALSPEAAETDRVISCVGIGMGDAAGMTVEARDAVLSADIVFGAARMLDTARCMIRETGPVLVEEYRADQIKNYLDTHTQYKRAVILLSGDIGFYSGADGIRRAFAHERLRYYCGISSVVYFASRIPTTWQDAKLISAHGRSSNVSGYVRRYPKVIVLSGTAKEAGKICEELVSYGLGHVKVTLGVNLSYPDEQIITGTPQEFLSCRTEGLHILLIQNQTVRPVITPGLPDESFIRGKVPMTKEEIRALSVAKLRLKPDSIVYDVGAGTGSVAVECARLCIDGAVFAIEKNPEGVSLISENSKKLCTANLSIVEGMAPEAMEGLPSPTHAFIGGSSGNLRQIVESLLQKNPEIRIVINTIALESIAETLHVIKELSIADADIVQVQAAKSRTLGRYHMMEARNPIYIVSFGGEKEE